MAAPDRQTDRAWSGVHLLWKDSLAVSTGLGLRQPLRQFSKTRRKRLTPDIPEE